MIIRLIKKNLELKKLIKELYYLNEETNKKIEEEKKEQENIYKGWNETINYKNIDISDKRQKINILINLLNPEQLEEYKKIIE